SNHKDNVIRYEGNRYSVPLVTFQSGAENIAYLSISEQSVSISIRPSDNPIAVHEISKEKGKVITDPKHRRRSQTKRDSLAEEVMDKLADPEDSARLNKILQKKDP